MKSSASSFLVFFFLSILSGLLWLVGSTTFRTSDSTTGIIFLAAAVAASLASVIFLVVCIYRFLDNVDQASKAIVEGRPAPVQVRR